MRFSLSLGKFKTLQQLALAQGIELKTVLDLINYSRHYNMA